MSFTKKIKSEYSNYSTGSYAAIGCTIGMVTGIAAGLILPPYVGWKIADYIAKAAQFSPFISVSAKIIGAVVLSGAAYSFTVPTSAVGGAAVGGAIGAGIGKIKDTLENLVSKG